MSQAFQTPESPGPHQPGRAGFGIKFLIASVVVVAVVGGVVALRTWRTDHTSPDNSQAAQAPVSSEATPVAAKTEVTPLVPTNARPKSAIPRAAVAAAPAPVAKSSHDLVAEMWEICGIHGPVTKEQAEKFKHHLEELIKGGAASVAAIREFLDKNTDMDFGQVEGGEELSYSSIRAAFLDALKQIGGPEAQSAMVQVLQTSAVPGELLVVAQNLEVDAPGQYRQQILKAAREALEMASANQLGTNAELGPAYRMLNTYGEAGTVEDAAKHDPANFYNAIAMANLPDGQGLPGLVQMAQNSNPDAGGKIVATEMIAQLATSNPQALDTLMQMAQNQQISNRVWTRLAPILAGEQYQMAPDPGIGPGVDPNAAPYKVVNNVTSADDITQRISLIDSFLKVVGPDTSAASALQHERNLLTTRLGN